MSNLRLHFNMVRCLLPGLLLTGWGCSNQPPGTPETKVGLTPGGDNQTPADVFAAAKTALQEKDVKKYATLLTDESRAALAGSLLLPRVALNRKIARIKHPLPAPLLVRPPLPASAVIIKDDPDHVGKMEAGFKPINDVYARHQIDEKTFDNLADALRQLDPIEPDMRRFRRILVSSAESLKDPGAFLHDGVLALVKLSGGKEDPGKDLGSEATLTNLQTRGDSAEAVLTFADGKTMSLHFVKSGVGWRIALPDQVFRKLIEGEGRLLLGQSVAGTITLDGKPLANAEIWFHSDAAKPVLVQLPLWHGGIYYAQLAPRDYRITIHPAKPSMLTHLLPYTDDPKQFEEFRPAAIPKHYTDPKTSGLTLEVRANRTDVLRDFALKSK
jgi:hypothetical protein